MASARLLNYWWPRRGATPLCGVVARATVRGESMGAILELGARSLLEAGAADRAAVWLQSAHHPEIYQGAIVEAGSGIVPEEWKQLDVSPPFFGKLLDSQQPLTHLRDSSVMSLIGPLVEMRSAVWLPLRVERSSLGLAMVAMAKVRPAPESELLRTVADEIALAVAQRQDREQFRLRREELAATGRLQQAILAGTHANLLLTQIAAQAIRYARAAFVALGQASPTPQDSPRFEILAGPREWAGLIHQEPMVEVWRTAIEQRRSVEVSLNELGISRPASDWFESERVTRLVAVPLEVRGQQLGVLLTGLAPSARPAAELERVESYATLATAALWGEDREKRLSEVESSYRAVLETSSEWILVLDPKGTIREASCSARQSLGLEPARLGRVQLEDLFSPSAREAIVAWRTATWSGQARAPLEAQLSSENLVRLRFRGGPRNVDREESRWHVAVEDIAALRASEQSSSQAEVELRTVLDSVDSGVLLFDLEGRVRLVNDRFMQLVGLDRRRTAELATFEALVEAIAGHFREPLAFAVRWRELLGRTEEASWDELELMRPTRKVIERFSRPVMDAGGQRLGWLEVYRDITGQRLIHSKLLQTEKMAALGQLVSGIAHELNNPLTSIMGYAQLLLGRRLEPELGADARMIYQEAERAGHIVKNLLLFAREAKPERRPVNLNEVVERTLALRSYELKIENIAVETQLDPDLPLTLADAAQMQQVILNLVVNAEQAMQQGRGHGHIRVRTQRLSTQRLALEVADDGPGIPPEVASRIFDPFFTTKPVGVGTGLGLSIVYGIIHEHGGEISVSSQLGQGAVFWIELPIVAAPAMAPNAEEAAPAPTPLPAAAPDKAGQLPVRRERVLVVEDEPTVAQLIADVLREEGHVVETVLDSREGLERLSRQEYDLVICDLKMPHLDGRAIYRALVRAGSPLQHRIVFVTGDTLTPHTLEFLDTCGLPYLAKPFLVEELKAAVRRALSVAPSPLQMVAGAETSGRPRDVRRKR